MSELKSWRCTPPHSPIFVLAKVTSIGGTATLFRQSFAKIRSKSDRAARPAPRSTRRTSFPSTDNIAIKASRRFECRLIGTGPDAGNRNRDLHLHPDETS